MDSRAGIDSEIDWPYSWLFIGEDYELGMFAHFVDRKLASSNVVCQVELQPGGQWRWSFVYSYAIGHADVEAMVTSKRR